MAPRTARVARPADALPLRSTLHQHGPSRRYAAPLLVGLAALAGAIAVTVVAGVPRPVYHDELSYLLAADLFAHGHASAPAHPHWQHFESFHVLAEPRYASKYPPGQGVLLALGQLAGAPIAGVWLGVAAMCAATTWMLRAFLPVRWAVAGGLLCLAQLGLLSYWGRGYWGGALAATGSALVFGAAARIARRPAVRPQLALALGFGLVVLASTRPFEGALVSLAAAWPLLGWLRRRDRRLRSALAVAIPAAIVLAVGGGATLLYNRAITGDPLRTPYAVHDAAYMATPAFVFQPLPPMPAYRHELQRRFYVDYLVGAYQAQQTWSGWAAVRLERMARSWKVLLGPVLTVGVVFGVATLRARGVRLALAATALFLVALAVSTAHHPHYAAPLVPPLFLLAVQGYRSLTLRWRRTGRPRTLAILIVVAATLAARLALPDPVLEIGAARSANRAKESVERHLEAVGGEHVVFVRHGPFADIHDEWVANGAAIDARRIVWARAMTPERDGALRAYYRGRRAWRVDIARDRPGVVDFVEIGDPAAAAGSTTSAAASHSP
jgi:hypothetical protein